MPSISKTGCPFSVLHAIPATAIYYAGLNRVVYSLSGEPLSNMRAKAKTGISCEELIDRKGGSTDVDGPVLETEGHRAHEDFHSEG